MNPLDHHSPYIFVPCLPTTTLSPPQDTDLPSFTVHQSSTWTYSGPLLSTASLPPSLHSWSAAVLSSPPALLQRLLPLLSFLETYLQENGVSCYWITLRATTPTPEYDTPRWHTDDDFFAPQPPPPTADIPATPRRTPSQRKGWRMHIQHRLNRSAADSREGPRKHEKEKDQKKEKKKEKQGNNGWKLCTTLLGPTTLFLPTAVHPHALAALHTTKALQASKNTHLCTSTRCAGCSSTSTAVRDSLAAQFRHLPAIQARCGEVAVFRTGRSGAVHSEPPCGVGRVFVNVVPGTEGELRGLMGRFGMQWPRDWVLGGGGMASALATVGREREAETETETGVGRGEKGSPA